MKNRNTRYTFVIDYRGGTYVRQACGPSPELALQAWLRGACNEEFESVTHRVELMRALNDQVAAPVEGCQNVWCMSGFAGNCLYLIHIIGTESGSGGKRVAEAQLEHMGTEPKQRGWGDHW